MTTIIDDRDTSVTYAVANGLWQHGGVSTEYMGTTTSTYVKGATATLKFSGTSVNVYGTVGPGGSPNCAYSIDGGDQTTSTAQVSSGTHYQVLFFQSTELTPGSHTLVITILSDSLSQILYLDSFAVTDSPPPSSTIILSSTQVFNSTQVFSSTQVFNSTQLFSSTQVFNSTQVFSSTQVITATTTPSETISHVVASSGTTSQVVSSKSSLGPIIGGVIGALALLTLAFIAFMYFWWKNKKHFHHRESNNVQGDGTG